MSEKKEHEFLTNDKILEILKKIESTQDVQEVDFKVRPGTEAGDNFGSELVRCDLAARVDGEEREYHWMVKCSLPGAGFSRDMRLEETEAAFYQDVLPK